MTALFDAAGNALRNMLCDVLKTAGAGAEIFSQVIGPSSAGGVVSDLLGSLPCGQAPAPPVDTGLPSCVGLPERDSQNNPAPGPNVSRGRYRVTGTLFSGEVKTIEIDIVCGVKWNYRPEWDSLDWVNCSGGTDYFARAAGGEAQVGTMVLEQVGPGCSGGGGGGLPVGWNKRSIELPRLNPDGSPGTLTVPVVVGLAYFDIDGTVQIPINVDVGGVKVTINFDPGSGKTKIGPGQGGSGSGGSGRSRDLIKGPGASPSVPPQYPPKPPAKDVDGDGKPDPDDLIVGAVVTVKSIGNVGQFAQDANPDIGIPDYGVIQFQCAVPGNRGAWTSDLKVKNRLHVIPCPWPYGAAAVAGTPRPGVAWVIEPIYDKRRLNPGPG